MFRTSFGKKLTKIGALSFLRSSYPMLSSAKIMIRGCPDPNSYCRVIGSSQIKEDLPYAVP